MINQGKRTFFLVAVLLFSSTPLFALTTSDLAVQVSATVQSSPPKITLTWPAPSDATGYTVYRKAPGDTSWGTGTDIGTATTYEDTNVVVGQAYEYRVRKTGSVTSYGYVLSGIEIPLVEDRGRVLLVVEDTYESQLADELSRLESDLVGDGWTVSRISCNRGESVPTVKNRIKTVYDTYPTTLKAIFLFGRVPVPYSGNSAWDGHSNHNGAWPADVFYGEMDGTWTDTTVNTTNPSRNENDNIPGDGKYDQSYLPSDAEVAVGRVDLYNMPAFTGQTEEDLLRQYLNKDHNFRHRTFTAQARGLIDDNFGVFGNEAFAASAWRSFAAMFGATNVSALDYFGTLATDSYLWSYGCGGGSYTSASGVGSTTNFASTPVNTVFTLLFGSYHGDWDAQNAFMRAPLAGAGTSLTCAWSGRPHWFFHHMALGETIGHSTLRSQNNNGALYTGNTFGSRGCHMGLMGDPTLRQTILAPASSLSASQSGVRMDVTWTASPDSIQGYHVYRATDLGGPFTRLTSSPTTETSFSEIGTPSGTQYYMVRAVRLETTASGSYYNPSQGIFTEIQVQPNNAPVIDSGPSATPQPAPVNAEVTFTVTASDPDSDPISITWNYGDGSSDATGLHTYTVPGVYTASVSVTDGVDTTTQTLTVVVGAVGGGGLPGGIGPDEDFDGDGIPNNQDEDDDNDGVSDANELADGTHPFDALSVNTTPMNVQRIKAGMKFNLTGRDKLSVMGVVPGLPAGFSPEGMVVTIDGGGARESFTLDAKGRAKKATGMFRLKLKFKRNKTTKELEFLGGDVRFIIKLKNGDFVAAWSDEGVDPNADAKKAPLTFVVDLYLAGRIYRATVVTSYSAKAGKAGSFKAKVP